MSQDGAETEDVADEKAERYYQQCYHQGTEGFDDGHGVIGEDVHYSTLLEGKEEVVYEIDIKRSATNVLQGATQDFISGEELLLCPEEAKQNNEAGESKNQTDEEATEGILCIRGEDIAIDVQDKVYDETDQQEPSSIEPLLYLCEILMNQTAHDEEEEVAPIDDAEQALYRFGYRDGIGDGCIIDGQEGYAHQEHYEVCIFAEQELCQSIEDEVLKENIGEPVSCFQMAKEG